MRLTVLRGLLIAALLTLLGPAWASTIVYRIRIIDDSNAVVPGATVALNTVKSFASSSLGTTVAFTTTGAGTVPYNSGGTPPVWNLTTNNINLSLIDLANGDYAVAYDPEGLNGEIIVNFAVTKPSGWSGTITGSNASISLILTKDSSRVLNSDVATSAVKTKTDTIGTNAADSPNAVTAQGLITNMPTNVWLSSSRTLSAFGFQSSIADAIWGAFLSTYRVSGSLGKKLGDVQTNGGAH